MNDLQETMISHHRINIAVTVSPFLELLENQKQQLTQTQWLHAVRILMSRIIENPAQYLSHDLPSPEITTEILRSIFHEFIMTHTPFQSTKRKSVL